MPLASTTHGHKFSLLRCALVGVAAAGALCVHTSSAQPAKTTFGFAVVSWNSANYETNGGKEECPEGFAVDNMQLYLSSLTPEARDKFTGKGSIDITFDFKSRRISAERGPKVKISAGIRRS